MNPIFGLMKMVEFGLEEAGLRDSLKTRQQQAEGGAALERANNPLQSAAAGPLSNPAQGANPNQSPAGPMSPMMPMDAAQAPVPNVPNPLMMNRGANPNMSPVMPQTPQATPDMFDKAMGLLASFNNDTGPKSPFQMILERTNIVEPTEAYEDDRERQRKKSPLEMMIGGR